MVTLLPLAAMAAIVWVIADSKLSDVFRIGVVIAAFVVIAYYAPENQILREVQDSEQGAAHVN